MTARPPVDVVIPFFGSADALAEVARKLQALDRAPGDSVTIVDNSVRGVAPRASSEVRVVHAPEVQSSYFARNAGAAGGAGEWLVFLDADIEPPADLLERYFQPPPGERTGVIGGAVAEIPEHEPKSLAARYTAKTQLINPVDDSGASGRFGYAVTANCAIRRAAFDAVGGFTGSIRSGGDADICFRLKRAGWELEWRPDARAVHRGRTTSRALVRQMLKHGAGIAWLEDAYPGFAPRPSLRELATLSARSLLQTGRAIGARDRDALALSVFGPLHRWAVWAGRWIPNDVKS
jgi:GT2 family glycosyltransferase